MCAVSLNHILLQMLVKDEQSRGLDLLETVNLTINMANFDLHNSEVTLNIQPRSNTWKAWTVDLSTEVKAFAYITEKGALSDQV